MYLHIHKLYISIFTIVYFDKLQIMYYFIYKDTDYSTLLISYN